MGNYDYDELANQGLIPACAYCGHGIESDGYDDDGTVLWTHFTTTEALECGAIWGGFTVEPRDTQ